MTELEELRLALRRLRDAGQIDDEEFGRQLERVEQRARLAEVEHGGLGAVLRVDPGTARRIVTSQVFWLVLVLAMMPLVMAAVGLPRDQGMIVYFALLWFVLFRHLFRLDLSTARPGDFALVAALVVMPGMVVILPGLMRLLEPLYRLVASSGLAARWLGFVLGVGVSEELAKALPVVATVWLARRTGRPIGLQASLLLGATAGLVFGGLENILYSEQFGTRMWGLAFTRRDVVLDRLLMTPFLHALWSGTVGFSIGLVAASGRFAGARLLRTTASAVAVVAVLHGTYNVVAFVPALAVAIGGLSYLVMVVAVVVAKRWEGAATTFLDERVL